MEWVFAAVIALSFILTSAKVEIGDLLLFAIPLLMLLVQTAWLLPALDARAELHLQGHEVPSSYLHFVYVAMEILKVGALRVAS